MAFLLQRNDLALTSLAFPDSKKPEAGGPGSSIVHYLYPYSLEKV